ncbi:MAG: inorganic phosphate transporter [Bacteroidia bacterium]|nr:inorganic phosphate transporter [Bacteroidia bacterium]MCF8425618.1 inorganic phosphate transporter [Bacteroidia bacterium]MCF8445679.1 inorganic phosphate transporter [Bacteroidia bacterium]
MTFLVIIIVLALIFDYINGFHDAANSIATIVSTKVLTPFQAVIWAAFFNFVAFFIFKDHAVANTIAKTVYKEYITLDVIFAGLIAAIIWNLFTWWYGIPSSSSHTLIGGFAGAAIAHAYDSTGNINIPSIVEMSKISKTVLFIFLAPLIGMLISMFITLVTIMQNVWYRISIMVLAAIGTFFLFGNLEQGKLKDNLAKYYQIDKLKKEVQINPSLQGKLDSAIQYVEAAKPYVKQYDALGSDKLAALIIEKVDPTADQKKLSKDLKKADNSAIVWGIMFVVLLFILAYLYVEKYKTPNAYRMANMFKKLQLLSSAAFSIGHGGNDAQKVMGIISAAMVANGNIADLKQMPDWVPLACYAAIGFGTLSGGWKIVKTMGSKITKVTPLEGVSAESAGALTLFMTEQMGIPVSTTHTITGSIIGVGATKRLSAVRWGVTLNLLWAWILTIPVSALLAGLTFYIIKLF